MKFYDGQKLLNLKDIDGDTPQIFFSTTNRGTGKTTFFAKYCLDNFNKTLVLCRYAYELDECGASFFSGATIFKKYEKFEICERSLVRNSIKEIILYNTETDEEKTIGLCVSLNNSDIIKKKRFLLNSIDSIVFDEFQSEDSNYCVDEVRKFISVISTVTTNWNNHKKIPIFMLSNQVSMINPYYTALKIEMSKNQTFYRGKGWVLENSFYEEIAQKTIASGVMQAFSDTTYVKYLSSKSYLKDYVGLIKEISTRNGLLLCNIKSKDGMFGLWSIDGQLYIAQKTNPQQKTYNLDTEGINEISIKSDSLLIQRIKTQYEQGKVIFQNQLCRKIFIDILKKKVYN